MGFPGGGVPKTAFGEASEANCKRILRRRKDPPAVARILPTWRTKFIGAALTYDLVRGVACGFHRFIVGSESSDEA